MQKMSLAEFSEKVRKLKSNISEEPVKEDESQLPDPKDLAPENVAYEDFKNLYSWNSDYTVLTFNPQNKNIIIGEQPTYEELDEWNIDIHDYMANYDDYMMEQEAIEHQSWENWDDRENALSSLRAKYNADEAFTAYNDERERRTGMNLTNANICVPAMEAAGDNITKNFKIFFAGIVKFPVDSSKMLSFSEYVHNCKKAMDYCNEIDLRNCDLSSVSKLDNIFYNCQSVMSLKFPDGFDGDSVTSMKGMFMYMEKIEEIRMPDFVGAHITSWEYTFYLTMELKLLYLPKFTGGGKISDGMGPGPETLIITGKGYKNMQVGHVGAPPKVMWNVSGQSYSNLDDNTTYEFHCGFPDGITSYEIYTP